MKMTILEGDVEIYASNFSPLHTGRNCLNLFQISFSANTTDAHPGVSGVSRDQKFCEKFKNAHCQVDHPAKIE